MVIFLILLLFFEINISGDANGIIETATIYKRLPRLTLDQYSVLLDFRKISYLDLLFTTIVRQFVAKTFPKMRRYCCHLNGKSFLQNCMDRSFWIFCI